MKSVYQIEYAEKRDKLIAMTAKLKFKVMQNCEKIYI
jgi:hypothetical protein